MSFTFPSICSRRPSATTSRPRRRRSSSCRSACATTSKSTCRSVPKPSSCRTRRRVLHDDGFGTERHVLFDVVAQALLQLELRRRRGLEVVADGRLEQIDGKVKLIGVQERQRGAEPFLKEDSVLKR